MRMTPAHSIGQAMEIADNFVPGGRIAVIPDGVSTLVNTEQSLPG